MVLQACSCANRAGQAGEQRKGKEEGKGAGTFIYGFLNENSHSPGDVVVDLGEIPIVSGFLECLDGHTEVLAVTVSWSRSCSTTQLS